MKKITLMALVALLFLASCNRQSPKAELETPIDSLSYSIGIWQTQGLKPYLATKLNVDTTQYIEDFTKGLMDFVFNEDPKKQAYMLGLYFGSALSSWDWEKIYKETLNEDTTKTINKNNIMAGINDGVIEDTHIMTLSQAKEYINKHVKNKVQKNNTQRQAEQIQRQTSYPPQQHRKKEPTRDYYICYFCHKIVASPRKPNTGGCPAKEKLHFWSKICPVGTKHSYSCKKCGITVEADYTPTGGGTTCIDNTTHFWTKVY